MILDFDLFDSHAKQCFEERLGEPEELSSIIGLISIAFNDLEEKISDGISILLNVDKENGAIITCELSYRLKVNMFSSLVQKLNSKYYFNRLEDDGFKDHYLSAFINALLKCEELRNKVMHSVFLSDELRENNTFIRKKITSKGKKGLVITNEKTDISHLLNIYDFTVSMQMEVDDFFIDFQTLDSQNNITKC